MATLKATGAQVYWMELPVMKSPRFGADMAQFNAIFEARALANSISFVRTEGLATGADGRRPEKQSRITWRSRHEPCSGPLDR